MTKPELLCKGLHKYRNENGFLVMRLHYTADPDKDEAWALTTKKGYIVDIWNQEMELDFSRSSGKRVYPEFRSDLHVTTLDPIPFRDIYRGWDFGYRHPFCVFFQIDEKGSPLVLNELMGTDIVINKFAEQVLEMSDKLYAGYTFKDAGDPAVRAKSDKNEKTTADILRGFGIRIQSRPSKVKDGINLVRNLLLPKYDGAARIKFDTKCHILIDGFLGGYVRSESDEESPEKDGFYEHGQDALRYGLLVLFNTKTYEVIRPARVVFKKRLTADASTGY